MSQQAPYFVVIGTPDFRDFVGTVILNGAGTNAECCGGIDARPRPPNGRYSPNPDV